MEDKLVTIAQYMDSMKAEMAMQVLADCGIKAILSGQHASDVYAGAPGVANVSLQVLQSKASEARQILETQEQKFTPEELEELDKMDESDGIE